MEKKCLAQSIEDFKVQLRVTRVDGGSGNPLLMMLLIE